jgi:PAS domain S-box-containing protein
MITFNSSMTGNQQPFDGKALNERLDVTFALQAAQLGIWELDPITKLVNWDDRCRELFGLAKDNLLPYEQAIHHIHPDDVDRVDQAVKWAMNPQSGGLYDLTYRTIGADDGLLRWVHFTGRGYFNEAGEVLRFAGIAQDVTRDAQTRQLEASEKRFRSLIEEAPIATCLFVGRELKIAVANQPMLSFWGKSPEVVGKPLIEAVPELIGQPFLSILDEVFTTGTTYEAKNARADLEVDGVMGTYYFDYTYKSLRNEAGQVYAIMALAVDVTQQVVARKALEESELFSRSVFYNSPVAKVVFTGQDMVIRTINENMLQMLGRDQSIIGQPFMEAMPELVPTPLLDRLRHVFTTGETFYQPEEKITLIRYGQSHVGYYNYIYKALHNSAGVIYGIMVTATEVTDQVLARQKIEEARESLRGAIELAQLGTWSLDMPTGLIEYSPRLRAWHGLEPEEVITREGAYRFVRKTDWPRVREAIAQAAQPGSDGLYDVEYTIEANRTGPERILHAQGKAYFNEQGQAYKVGGTVQDITVQKQLQLALEQQVQERTEELAAANEELAAINEELVSSNEKLETINEDLSESNQLLSRSNLNLEQFAYVASHDLQEPLRKVQQFGDLLKNQYKDQLGEGVDYLERMQVATRRMSTLIRDLLTFSRISTQRDTTKPVVLNQVVNSVLMDLELIIGETAAKVQIDPLPTIQGDALQLGQLFQNLISNALKFRRADIAPQIQVHYQTLTAAELPEMAKPTRMAAYFHRIDVSDNGLGFEQKHAERIFQVFQRLHGRNQYAGTGIGLAICEKVTANHGGAITASSQPGQGATFSVYLPVA